jgi:hypothetical protein
MFQPLNYIEIDCDNRRIDYGKRLNSVDNFGVLRRNYCHHEVKNADISSSNKIK